MHMAVARIEYFRDLTQRDDCLARFTAIFIIDPDGNDGVGPCHPLRSEIRISARAGLRLSSVEDLIENPIVDLMDQRLAMGEPPRRGIRAVQAFLLALRGHDILLNGHIPTIEVVLDDLLEVGPPQAIPGE